MMATNASPPLFIPFIYIQILIVEILPKLNILLTVFLTFQPNQDDASVLIKLEHSRRCPGPDLQSLVVVLIWSYPDDVLDVLLSAMTIQDGPR